MIVSMYILCVCIVFVCLNRGDWHMVSYTVTNAVNWLMESPVGQRRCPQRLQLPDLLLKSIFVKFAGKWEMYESRKYNNTTALFYNCGATFVLSKEP